MEYRERTLAEQTKEWLDAHFAQREELEAESDPQKGLKES